MTTLICRSMSRTSRFENSTESCSSPPVKDSVALDDAEGDGGGGGGSEKKGDTQNLGLYDSSSPSDLLRQSLPSQVPVWNGRKLELADSSLRLQEANPGERHQRTKTSAAFPRGSVSCGLADGTTQRGVAQVTSTCDSVAFSKNATLPSVPPR